MNQATSLGDLSNGDPLVREILTRFGLSPSDLAIYIGTSLVSVIRWGRGDTKPNSVMKSRLAETLLCLKQGQALNFRKAASKHVFAARGAPRSMPLFEQTEPIERLDAQRRLPLLSRLRSGTLWGEGSRTLATLLTEHTTAATTINCPVSEGISAGKNTYTYDAHTYHTKVPPQGIAEVIRRYLPNGGLVLDPFAGVE